jgi:hypothetical protein
LEARFERLEAQVAGLAEESQTSKLLEQRLTGVESNVAAFTGTLEHFLGRIQIDDRLRLVPDHRIIHGPPGKPLDIVPSHSASIVELTNPDADPMALDIPILDVESGDEDDTPMIPSPVAGTATTPSEIQEDDRMELPRLSPIPPEPTHPIPDMVMAPPPPPPPFPQFYSSNPTTVTRGGSIKGRIPRAW